MGADLFWMAKEEAETRSTFALKVSKRINCEIMYSKSGIPADRLKEHYAGISITDTKGNAMKLNVPIYEDAVWLYDFITNLKRELS